MKGGYIKLHRKMLDNSFVLKDNDYFAVWVYLLLTAAHKETVLENCSKIITLKPGQLITGREALGKKLHISNSKIERILNLFESAQMIAQIKKPRKGRIITILNWDKYQEREQINEQIMDKFQTNFGQIVDGNKNIKNNKNEKNIKEKIYKKEKSDFATFNTAILNYSANKKIQEALYNFIDMRNQKKNPFTEYSFSEFLKRLDSFADNDDDKAEILRRSIIAGYPNIYQLPQNERSRIKNDDDDEYKKIGWA